MVTTEAVILDTMCKSTKKRLLLLKKGTLSMVTQAGIIVVHFTLDIIVLGTEKSTGGLWLTLHSRYAEVQAQK